MRGYMKNSALLITSIFCSTVLPYSQDNVLDTFYPEIENYPHLWVRADIIGFLPHAKSIIATNQPTDLFTTADVTLKPDCHLDFKWDVGFRAVLGYLFSNNRWDMTINWTHFNTHAQQCKSTQGNIGLGMFPVWSLADDILAYDWISISKIRWNLKLNVIDLDFGRLFEWCNRFFLRPTVGLRAAVIDQHIKVRYGGGIFANGLNLPALDSTFGYDTIFMKNNFWGIGPRVGIEPQVNLGCGWRFFASAYGTFTAAVFDICQRETYLKTLRSFNRCCSHKARGMFDATAGILWKTFIRNNRYALTYAFTWEYHRFFKQIEFKGDKFGLVSCDRDLSLQGIGFSASFDF